MEDVIRCAVMQRLELPVLVMMAINWLMNKLAKVLKLYSVIYVAG